MPVHSSVQQAHTTPIALDSVISGGQSLGLALYCLDLNQPAGLPPSVAQLVKHVPS